MKKISPSMQDVLMILQTHGMILRCSYTSNDKLSYWTYKDCEYLDYKSQIVKLYSISSIGLFDNSNHILKWTCLGKTLLALEERGLVSFSSDRNIVALCDVATY